MTQQNLVAPISVTGFELTSWQQEAVDRWMAGDHQGPFRGTLEIVTGGGKTLLALSAIAAVSEMHPELRAAVVVPTEALAHQWREATARHTTLRPDEIGLLGAGGRDTFESARVLVCVLNTAAKRLPELGRSVEPLMLVVDECHRAGAPTFSKVLETPARFRLGLSATPDREELDEDGEPLTYDEQKVGQALGSVVCRFSLRDARQAGWLPEYELHHHAVRLTEGERREYEQMSREIDDLKKRLEEMGVADVGRARQVQGRDDEVGKAAHAYLAATSKRKDLLYRARERTRVAARIVFEALDTGKRRILLFHERVAEAEKLFARIRESAQGYNVALEHSRLSDGARHGALEAFRAGEAHVLVSVKSLVEGIDVPEADVGVSVAASSSVRQRIQSLGRVLRRGIGGDESPKRSAMHLLYVDDTVDDLIYGREDWSDLTGERANWYWRWPLDPDQPPEQLDGPPRSPKPTEEQEWERLGERPPDEPVEWQGVVVGQEYSVDTMGTVTNASGAIMANPQGVAEMVKAVRGREGGHFRVTPAHLLVLVHQGKDGGWMVAGGLAEPFVASGGSARSAADLDVGDLTPGAVYEGPDDREGGTFKISARRGGVIERKVKGGSEYALTDGTDDPALAENAKRVLEAWGSVLDRGVEFHVNDASHAWYVEGGQRRFLADVPGGFGWPSAEGGG